jgi:AP endonuclease-2
MILCFFTRVATFCRVKSAFSSSEVALPVAAEEGFTRFVDWSKRRKGLQEFAKDGLVKVDGEGRCIIADHDHFAAF